jgi:uncharacterized repeat protein (TIGR01451 family)
MQFTFRKKMLAARMLTVASLTAAGLLLTAVAASAGVGNPGDFTFTVTGGSLSLGALSLPMPLGSMAGQIDSTGAVSIPQSSVQLTDFPINESVSTPVGTLDVTGTANVSTTGLSGTIDPATGQASLSSSLYGAVSFAATIPNFLSYTGTCSIGDPANFLPITMTTGSPGVPYSDQTGGVTLAANLGSAVSCDPALPVELTFFVNGSAELTLSGTTTPILLPDGHLSATPNPLAFGDVQVGSSSTMTVTFSDGGSDDTFISEPLAISGQNPGDFTVNLHNNASTTCVQSAFGLDVPAGGSCTIEVIFAPSTTGDRSASLVLANSSVDGTQTLALTGTGTAPALSLSPTSLDFGQQHVGTSDAQTVVVTNTGTASLIVGIPATTGDFTADATACNNQPVLPGQTCDITVTFSPSTTGPQSGNLSVTSNAASSPDTVALTGTGVNPLIAVTPGGLTFGTVPIGTISNVQTITVTNSGTTSLHVAGTTVTAPFMISDGCSGGGAIAPGSSCQIGVQFAPAGTGSASGALTITSDGGTATVALTGSGSPSADLNVSMGAEPNPAHRNKTLTYVVTVQNAGPSAASGLVAVDQLPSTVQFFSISAAAGSNCITPAVGATGTVKCTVGSLAAGSSLQLTVTVLVVAPKGATISNTVQVTASSFDPDLLDNRVTVLTSVQ